VQDDTHVYEVEEAGVLRRKPGEVVTYAFYHKTEVV